VSHHQRGIGRREFLRLSALAAGGVVLSACAPQPTPSPAKLDFPAAGEAITLIVPWPAGGSADVSSRVLAASLEKQVGVPVRVENLGGAGSQIGLTEFVRSTPNGYTLTQVPTPTFMTLYLDPSRQAIFTRKDFQPVAAQMEMPGCIAVRADSPYQTLEDLVEAAKANPGQITAGTAGIMGQTHLQLVWFEQESGTKFAQVNFEGGAPLATALLGGHIDSSFGIEADYLAQAKSGQLRILGVMSHKDSAFLPDVKSLASQGYEVYMSTTRQIAAPAGTPMEIVNYLNEAITQSMADPDYIKRMEEGGFQPSDYMTPEEIESFWADLEDRIKELMTLAEQK
jgi:tripartite-type tricarboxylate transporter receptor subunit TctC